MAKERKTPKELSIDPTVVELLEKAQKDGVSTVFDRAAAMGSSCPYGLAGLCCRHCSMGPCRLSLKGGEPSRGVCGANADVFTSRNLARAVAAGTSAHSDHGLHLAYTLLHAAEGKLPAYEINDEKKLMNCAAEIGIGTEGKDVNQIGREVAQFAIDQYERSHADLVYVKTRVPEKRRKIWEEHNVVPHGVCAAVVDTLHRTTIGMTSDYKSMILNSMKTSLTNGWAGSMWATEISDILFGCPGPIRGEANLGVLSEDKINIIIHGHEPTLSNLLVDVAEEKEIQELAQKVGAKGINFAGICCTANEVLMRKGVSLAGNFFQQELALVTVAVEAMVVDVQCIMPVLPEVASHYHTKIISTSPKADIGGADIIHFDEEHATEIAHKILKIAIDNYKNRDAAKVQIPKNKTDLVAGFTHETINYMLGGNFRASYHPLVDAIKAGRIFGVVGIVGCNNTRLKHDQSHVDIATELIKNNVLVVQTGCSAIATAKAGLMVPEAKGKAGEGLKEICEAVGCPPVVHVGSCVDNTRILKACYEMVAHGLAEEFDELPVAGVALENMSEKALSIGNYFVASGVTVYIGTKHQVNGSPNVEKMLYHEDGDLQKIFGARFVCEPDPQKAVEHILALIKSKREALKI